MTSETSIMKTKCLSKDWKAFWYSLVLILCSLLQLLYFLSAWQLCTVSVFSTCRVKSFVADFTFAGWTHYKLRISLDFSNTFSLPACQTQQLGQWPYVSNYDARDPPLASVMDLSFHSCAYSAVQNKLLWSQETGFSTKSTLLDLSKLLVWVKVTLAFGLMWDTQSPEWNHSVCLIQMLNVALCVGIRPGSRKCIELCSQFLWWPNKQCDYTVWWHPVVRKDLFPLTYIEKKTSIK